MTDLLKTTFKSRALAKVMDLLCEGEIELVNGLKGIYLDKTPVQNDGGSFNFSNLVAAFRPGTIDQSLIQGFESTENAVAVGLTFAQDTPITRTVTNTDIDGISLTFKIPRLFRQTDKGKIRGTQVDLLIEVSTDGGDFVTVANPVYDGESESGFEFSYRVNVRGTTAPWVIRCTQQSSDTDLKHQRDIQWESYTEVVDSHSVYPFSAVAAITYDSTQFSSVPATAYHVRKVDIQVPANYNENTREYFTTGDGTTGGIWDGTFKRAFSDNPAWLFYDLLTHRRYGAGRWIDPALINKWELYRIAQYCDELVPDGKGGMEPRFSCFVYLQSPDEAFNVLQQLASIFRGVSYYTAGSIEPAQDRPSDPVALFTRANVVDGLFSYQGTSRKATHTVALVSWIDPDNFYQQVVEYVEHPDPDMIQRYGLVPLEMVAVGCKSQGQARRAGLHALYSESLEAETVTFVAGLEGSTLKPFDIVQISDPKKTGQRLGGRIISATATSVVLDAPVPAGSYSLSLINPGATPPVVTRAVVADAETAVLAIDVPLDTVPPSATVWTLTSDAAPAALWRILGRKETAADRHQVTAMRYAPAKYALIETALQVTPPSQPDRRAPGAVAHLLISENTNPGGLLGELSGGVGTTVSISWDIDLLATEYELIYVVDSDNPVIERTSLPRFQVSIGDAGHYSVQLTAIRRLQDGTERRGQPVTVEGDIVGLDGVPDDISGLAMLENGDATLTFSWDLPPEVTVQVGGHIEIRMGGADWDSASVLTTVPGTTTSVTVAAYSTTYRFKAITAAGQASAGSADSAYAGSVTVPSKAQVIQSSVDAVAIGVPMPWPFDATTPAMYLRMDGSTYNVDDYPELGALYGGMAGGTFNIADWTGVPVWGAAMAGEAGNITGDDERDLSHSHDAGTLDGSEGNVSGLTTGGAASAGDGSITIAGDTGTALGTIDVLPRRARAWWIQRALK